LVDDEELAEAMKESGLGTPATRASIIEKLLNEKYLVREARELTPTGKAFELLTLLNAMKIDVLASPELTGEWEYKLNQILKGGMTRDEFMAEIRKSTSSIIEKIKDFREDAGSRPEAEFSPVNGVQYFETASAYVSGDEKTVIRKILGGRIMEQPEIVSLLEGETIGPFSDFRSKQGKPFSASIRILNCKVEFIFAESDSQLDIEEVKKSEPVGLSPTDKAPVFETPAAFISASALDGDKKKGLRISKMILARQIEREHIVQLLEDGKTELIKGFISKRKKPFDAYLLLDTKGKISFEFPPREKKSRKK
jgi:DNA topoisomerase-3